MGLFEALLWITLNVYHEARSEDLEGKKAVAHVTFNRANNRGLSIKETVKQPYQFSWVHQLPTAVPKEWAAFVDCFEAVTIALGEEDFTQGATHYHLASMNPYPPWAHKLEFIAQFGSHRFYKKKKKKKRIRKHIHATKTKVWKSRNGKNQTIHRKEKVF